MFLRLQLDDWVLCRIYKKEDRLNKSPKQNEDSSPHEKPTPQGPPQALPNNGNNVGEIANYVNNMIVPQVPAPHSFNYSPGSYMHGLGVSSSYSNFSGHYETNFNGVVQHSAPIFQNQLGNIALPPFPSRDDHDLDYGYEPVQNLDNIDYLYNGYGYDQLETFESI